MPSDAVARSGVCSVACMAEEMVPVFRVTDAASTARWYARMGYRVVGEHRFAVAVTCEHGRTTSRSRFDRGLGVGDDLAHLD